MPRKQSGSGSPLSASGRERLERRLGLVPSRPVDINEAGPAQLAELSRLDRRRAGKIIAARRARPFGSPAGLLRAGIADVRTVQQLEGAAYGETAVRPVLRAITADDSSLWVGEDFAVDFAWRHPSAVPPAVLSATVRFPSGQTHRFDKPIGAKERRGGHVLVAGFRSGESGQLTVHGCLRDAAGGVSEASAVFSVFTRNPVQMYVSPTYLTQSGSVGAPKYDFGSGRWYCYADVRWVNGESRSVNLGRRVRVRASDAGVGQIADFSFDLSSDVVIPALSTIYGNLYTWHGSGSIFDVFSAKGDLTFVYSMSGSGFSPTRSVVWRTMRAIGYNIIRVGDFTSAERLEYREAAEVVASNIFRSRDMTVYGTELYRIEGSPDMDADKARWRFIDDDGEFDAMASKYSVPNWFMDVFMVEGYFGGFGASYVDAPTDKGGARSGIVIGRDGDTVNLGQTFAHEAGHHLGLEHADESDGCGDTDPSSPTIDDNFIFSSSRRDSAAITGCQINKMRRHGFVRSMTP